MDGRRLRRVIGLQSRELCLAGRVENMTDVLIQEQAPGSSINISTRIYVAILGTLAGVGGVLHGVSEMLLGNKPAVDILLRVGAFTILPNYLGTGICAAVVGISVVVWSIVRIHKKWGPTTYLALSVSLALVGGGIALIPGSILAWAVATRIREPLLWWRKALGDRTRTVLSNLWPLTLSIGFGLFMIGFGIWSLVLPPGKIREVTVMHYICWTFLSTGTLFLVAAIACGFARDIEKRAKKEHS